MLYAIAMILLVLWVVGLVSSYTMGGFIHILLVIAIGGICAARACVVVCVAAFTHVSSSQHIEDSSRLSLGIAFCPSHNVGLCDGQF